ncbi:hypothetical protein CASFOL_019468 [Castilleja foliolosa]|uniref:CYCLOIDEA-like protein n=1 Tax=Castilleja foliolosa TaxID=1961234 RepID=A0ABD3D5Q0_9LAMI
MVALFSPPSDQLSSLGWLLEDPISHELENMNYFFGDDKTKNLRYSSNSSANKAQQITKNDKLASLSDELVDGGDEGKMLKKLDHNASERDRRKTLQETSLIGRTKLGGHFSRPYM